MSSFHNRTLYLIAIASVQMKMEVADSLEVIGTHYVGNFQRGFR